MSSSVTPAAIVLADGTTFEGEAIGADAPGGLSTGEFVFNTVLSGYQEVISDPSYAGQVITFTYPHIGNYGVNAHDDESARPRCAGVVVRDLARRHSNQRAEGDLDAYLRRHGIPGVAGIDTRRLTRHLRDHGAIPGAFGTAGLAELKAAAVDATGTDGRDLVAQVTAADVVVHPSTTGAERRVVAFDLGIKTTIVRNLATVGEVHVVPATTTAAQVLDLAPDGVFLSNGPGDPGAVAGVPATVRELLGRVPIFGICMGHQMLATALGGATFKLPFGHHGGNHPVRDLATGKVEITSQNHNYCVDPESLERVEVTHVNLNDGTLEGFRCLDVPAFGIQYHPEAGPGPHDSRYLFERFAMLMDEAR
ncbi:MAG: glutamine-hydrolyzing carbamoyl-phosphate synthase small subunit [Microthrixaceae bacterium]